MKSPLAVNPVIGDTLNCCKTDGLFFEVKDYVGDLSMPAHAHKYAHFVFHLKGNVTQSYRKQTHLAIPGTLVFLPLGEVHATHFQEAVRTFQIVLKPQWIERLQQSSVLLHEPRNYTGGLPIEIAMRIHREFEHRDNLSPLMLEGLMFELLTVMCRHPANSTESHVPRWLKQARDLLHDRFMENLSLTEIATSVGVHPSHLMECFRRHYHCTVGDYIRRLRVESAVHLLSTSDMPAGRIAHMVGFADQSHFCRTFKLLTGMTPLQYQKLYRDNPSLRQEIRF